MHEKIKNLIILYGFTLTEMDLHEEFFNSWRYFLEKNNQSYLIEKDGRDGWLYFYKIHEKNGQLIDAVRSHTFNECNYIEQCDEWLKSI